MSIPFLPGSLSPNKGDLANGFYPNIMKVDVDDPEFIDVVRWLEEQSGGKVSAVLNVRQEQGRKMPTEIIWVDPITKTEIESDAAMTFSFPHDTLNDLQKAFGFGDSSRTTYYPGLRKPAVSIALPSPIGVQYFKGDADNEYTAIPNADSDVLYPVGTIYSDGTGRYRKEKRRDWFRQVTIWVKL